MADNATDVVRTPRQRELIEAAAKLFADRGYHAVGINEISNELGLTGPAFYRHFKSKEEILVAVLSDVISSHLAELRSLIVGLSDPLAVMHAIIDYHVAFVFEQTANLVTWRTEFRSIPDIDRRRMVKMQLQYIQEWVDALMALRPELTADRARAMTYGTISMIQSPTEFHSKLSRTELAPILAEMARKLLIPSGPAPRSARTAARHPRRKTTAPPWEPVV